MVSRQRFLTLMGAAAAVAGATSKAGQAADYTQGITSDTILIGSFAPFTGKASLYGTIDAGLHLVYQKINEEGGINGRKIQVITMDDECSDTSTIAAVRDLIYQKKVFIVHGGNCSNAVLAAKSEILKAGIPFVGQGAVADGIYYPTAPNIFAAQPTSRTIAPNMIEFVATKPGVKSIGIVKQTDDWGMSQYQFAVERAKQLKIDISIDLDLTNASSVDLSPQVLRLKAAKPDAIIAILYPQPLSVFLRDRMNLGLDPAVPVLGRGALPEELKKMFGNNLAGVKNYFGHSNFTKPISDPIFSDWTRRLRAYDPKLDSNSPLPYGTIPGALAIVDALRRSGRNPTWGSFLKAMDSVKNLETGFTTPISYTPTDHYGIKKCGFEVLSGTGKSYIVLSWADYQRVAER